MNFDVLSRKPPLADRRIAYGPHPAQFGDLWMPAKRSTRCPVVVFLHGGWWQSIFDLAYASELCDAIRHEGFAVWSLEYRRVGGTGGGWPGTFQDVATGFDYLANLARTDPIDLSRVVTAGHSAGGHLALWLAGRHHIPPQSPLFAPQPKIALRGVVALAGAVDLRLIVELSGLPANRLFAADKHEVYALMGGTPELLAERYRAGNPGDLLPLNVRQVLLQGTADSQIPPQLPARWAALAGRQGDAVTVRTITGADHLDVVDPRSSTWPVLRATLHSLLG